MNHVKVLFFATLRDKAGTKMIEMDIEPGATVEGVKNIIAQRFPDMKEALQYCLASVNYEYSGDAAEIPPAAEIAFFPPVSGGGR